ncbi:hypothetical protein EJ08DRAFT_573526, partial [Tothia fuscella]
WQAIALTSGLFASLNATFAKLTTASTTSTLSNTLHTYLPSNLPPTTIEYTLRVAIFALSLLFTGTMWALYTKALSAAPSAVHANIVNTASNFLCTALLGMVVFGEEVNGLWWMGAGCLVAGTVVIGRREE